MSIVCSHKRYKESSRTFSDYVPGYAQGAVFPDDEEGYICDISGSYCNAEFEESLRYCPELEIVDELCPICKDFKRENHLYETPDGILICLHCEYEE